MVFCIEMILDTLKGLFHFVLAPFDIAPTSSNDHLGEISIIEPGMNHRKATCIL